MNKIVTILCLAIALLATPCICGADDIVSTGGATNPAQPDLLDAPHSPDTVMPETIDDDYDDVITDAADEGRVLLDYSISTIDVVSMGALNYYVVSYKNVICGRGIEIFMENGTAVTNASTADSILDAVAWKQAASTLNPDDLGAIKTLVGSPQAIEMNRVGLITSCDSLEVLSNDITSSEVTDCRALTAFSERVLDTRGTMVELENGTGFFLKSVVEHRKKISAVAQTANSTKKSLYKDWTGRNHAKSWIFGALVLVVILLVSATALIFMKSKEKELSIKKRAHKLFERKKETVIDQLHSRDADERARSALMAGASAEIDESVIPHLIVLLDDVDDRVRANAAQSIRRIGQKNKNLVQFAKDPLKRHLDDPNDKVRDAVADAYQVVSGEATEEAGRVEAVEKSGEVGVEEAEPAATTARGTEEATAEAMARASLTDEQRRRLHELKRSVNQSINSLPAGCDLCIPHYLLGVGTTIVDLIEHAANAKSEAIDEMIDAGSIACKYITNLIESGRFIDICISKNMGAFDDTGFVCGIKDYSDQLDALIRDPAGFVDSLNLEEELWETDRTITGKMGELMIIPISGLWKVSKSVFDDATDESGTKRAFLVLISYVILGRIREMMENPEIVKRLRL